MGTYKVLDWDLVLVHMTQQGEDCKDRLTLVCLCIPCLFAFLRVLNMNTTNCEQEPGEVDVSAYLMFTIFFSRRYRARELG